MKKIGLIGGGNHSRHNHLPAIQRYHQEHPGAIELTSFCDISPAVAAETAAKFGFKQSFTSVESMLAESALDGVIAVTPLEITKQIAEQIIEAGIPMVIEKPPGKDLIEAREICELVAAKQARVMVSVNRRFDPALVAAKDWLAGREVAFFRAAMLRNNRTEEDFFTSTGLHTLDAMRWFAGDVVDYQLDASLVNGVRWYRVNLQFASGAKGLLEVLPSCGMREECYEFYGPDFRVLATNGEMSTGECCIWEQGELTKTEPAAAQPGFIRNGTLAETAEFIASLEQERTPQPTPEDVVKSLELCWRIRDDATT